MTNYEYHKEKLEEIWLDGRSPAVDKDGNVTICGNEIECKNCIFNIPAYNGCSNMRKAWYKKKAVVKLEDDLSNLAEYAKSRDVDIEIPACALELMLLGARLDLQLIVRKVFEPSCSIELTGFGGGGTVTAKDITKAVDALYNIFPEKEENHE